MKKQMYFQGLLMSLLIIIIVSCEQQPPNTQNDLTEINQEMQEVSNLIEETINEESVHLFINKTDMALNELEDQIDEFLSVLDNANERIDKGPRNSIIEIKQKIAAIDFRLAILDDENLIGGNPYADTGETSDRIDRIRPPVYGYHYPYSMGRTTATTTDVDRVTMQEMEQYAQRIHQEIVDELRELKSTIDEFGESNLEVMTP
jgi:septal ring factor EnvC (AmiA/AmiB activator)